MRNASSYPETQQFSRFIMFPLKRFSLMLMAIVFVALFISPQPAHADNVVITSGGLGRGRTAEVHFGLGGDGLSFNGHGFSTAVFCSSCPGGSIVNASMPFDFENSGGATVNGVHYQSVFYTGSIFLSSSPITMPLDDPTLPLIVTAAFTMSGNVIHVSQRSFAWGPRLHLFSARHSAARASSRCNCKAPLWVGKDSITS